MSRQILKREEALKLILKGVEDASQFITQTMGPGGKLVGFTDGSSKFRLTKDGANAAKLIKNLGNSVESAGASLVVEACQEMLKNVGDGTTTVAALLYSLIKSTYNLILAEYNLNDIKKSLEKLPEILEREINLIAKNISVNDEEIQRVAFVSSNGETSIGEKLSELIHKLGKDFVILVEDSKTGKDEIILRDGFHFDRGATSPYFFFKPEEQSRMKIFLEDCQVLVVGEKLTNIRAFSNLINQIAQNGKPLLIVADDIDEDITAIFVTNKIKLGLNYICVKAPLFGEKRQMFLEDLALISGAKIVNPSQDEKISLEVLGKARKVIISRDMTTLIGGNFTEEDKNQRIAIIKNLITHTTSIYEKEKMLERLARLQNGIGIFQVGGKTEMEITERKERVEDAIHACKNAILGGVVPGAGSEFLWVLHRIILEADPILKILATHSLESIPRTIIRNTNKASEDVIINEINNKIKCGFFDFGFNESTGRVENLMDFGIINPAKVSIEAIKIAVSLTIKYTDLGSLMFEEINSNKKISSSYNFE